MVSFIAFMLRRIFTYIHCVSVFLFTDKLLHISKRYKNSKNKKNVNKYYNKKTTNGELKKINQTYK